MAVCGSLEHIFEKPLPENPTLLESLSQWKQIKSMKPIDDHSSFTELFGELHFKESNSNRADTISLPSPSYSSLSSSSLSSISSSTSLTQPGVDIPKRDVILNKSFDASSYYNSSRGCKYKQRDSFSSDSLSLCTEGLGFESFDEVEDLLTNDACNNTEWRHQEERKSFMRNCNNDNNSNNNDSYEVEGHSSCNESKRSRTSTKGEFSFPPPISCIGRSGKPWVCLKSFREDGRFILKEIRIPTQEFLHAFRENGRLRLQFIQSDDETLEGDQEEEDDDNEDEGENNEVKKNEDEQDDRDHGDTQNN